MSLIRGHRAPNLPDPLPVQHQLLPRPGGRRAGSDHRGQSEQGLQAGGFPGAPNPIPHLPWQGGRGWECQVCRTDGQEVKPRFLERLDRPNPEEGKDGKNR